MNKINSVNYLNGTIVVIAIAKITVVVVINSSDTCTFNDFNTLN